MASFESESFDALLRWLETASLPDWYESRVKDVLLDLSFGSHHPDSRRIYPAHPHARDEFRYLRVPYTQVDIIYATDADERIRFVDWGLNLDIPDD